MSKLLNNVYEVDETPPGCASGSVE